jgi:hypothetical protein
MFYKLASNPNAKFIHNLLEKVEKKPDNVSPMQKSKEFEINKKPVKNVQ